LQEVSAKLGLAQVPRLDGRCLPILSGYRWPGNVRELRNVLERALILTGGDKISPEALGLLDLQQAQEDEDTGEWGHLIRFPTESQNLNDVSKILKAELIKEALRRTGGVQKDAAKLLGISVDSFKYQAKSLKY
jgi:DNA-binding NtrC family response regulator